MPRKRREIPWIELRDGTYYVYWYAENGRTKRISLRTTDSVEAQTRYAAFLAQGHNIFAEPGGPVGLTVSQALDDYRREHVAEKVVDKDRADDVIAHLKAWFRDTILSTVDIPASRAYADARRAGIVGGGARRKMAEGSDSTIRRELVVLNAAANHAARWKRIGPSAEPPTAMPSVELPAETPSEAVIWLTPAELQRAIDAATGRLRDFIVLVYRTGARRASIERLTKFQVDLAQSRINLRSPHENANQRRSKKRRPVVPIDAQMRPVIERLLSESTTEWVFGAPREMYWPFHNHMRALGFPDEKAHPHVLRHSRATHLLLSGVSIYDVARLLGDTVATVERVYGHHSAEYLAVAVQGGER